MKKIIFVCLTFLLLSCKEKGEITTHPHEFISIHGKTYLLMSIVPCDDCHSIWIMYPKDSTESMPQVLNYSVPSGKTTINQSVIKID